MIVDMQNDCVVEEEDELVWLVRLGSASGCGGNKKDGVSCQSINDGSMEIESYKQCSGCS